MHGAMVHVPVATTREREREREMCGWNTGMSQGENM